MSACLCTEEARVVSASVHGDDVTVEASSEDAEWLIQKFKERNEIKTQMIGEVKEVIKALGLEGGSPVPTPGVAAKGETTVEDNDGSIDPELEHEETTMFPARLNDLSQDRPDITFATMKLCSKMSRPDAQDLKNIKRVCWFLVARP